MQTIPGLSYQPAYLSPSDTEHFIAIIDQQPWLTDLKRRVQHYGYRYDYKKRAVDPSMYLGALPTWIAPLAERLQRDKLTHEQIDQVIINEYAPGQGIASHIDCLPCFGDTIISISLGSACVMQFSHVGSGREVPILLEPGSAVVMQGEARFRWKHGIAARKTDSYQGITLTRGRRISITFRHVIQP